MTTRLIPTVELPRRNCSREHLYDLLRSIMLGPDAVDGTYLSIVDGHAEPSLFISRWRKFTVTFAQLAAAATSNHIELFVLPAGGIIERTMLKHTVAFGGGAISAYAISVGIVGTLNKYAGLHNVGQAVGNTVFQLQSTAGAETFAAAGTSIRVAAESTSANLDAATAGSCDIWIKYGAVQ